MILDQIKTKNQKLSYYKSLLIIIIAILLAWLIIAIQSGTNQKFSDKQAQAAASPLSPDFKLEILNSLEDKYNPTELELRKITPYTESRVSTQPIPDFNYQEADDSDQDLPFPESTDLSNNDNNLVESIEPSELTDDNQ